MIWKVMSAAAAAMALSAPSAHAAPTMTGAPVPAAATAANEWMIPAWRDVYRLAPAGAKAMGRTATLQQIKRTCDYLRRGTPAAWVVGSYFDIALASGTSRQQQADMVMYSTAVLVVATKRLCPSYTAEVWDAISES